MIGFMPEIYPDELIYSTLARYANRSGYLLNRAISEELFENSQIQPDILFLNRYKSEVIEILTKNKTMDDLIRHHTMFNNYGLFLMKERLNDAYDSFIHMAGNYRQKLPKTLSGHEKTLKYCPVCAQQDLLKYSETYWHRSWQIEDIEICPIHHCQLHSTNISLSAKAFSKFISAQEVVPNNAEIIYSENKRQIELAKYMYEVFQQDFELDNNFSVGDFLHSHLQRTKYVSPRGQQRNMELLYDDFMNYYATLPYQKFNEMYHLQKLFNNKRMKFIGVCMLGMFLNITPYDLVHRSLPEYNVIDEFDRQVYSYRNQGFKYTEIAKKMNASYDVVKLIGEGRYNATKKLKRQSHNKGGVRAIDWNKKDLQMLPLVKKALQEMWKNSENDCCPIRITTFAVTKKLNVHSKYFTKLPECKKEIKKYEESFPVFWARKVAWAVNFIAENGHTLNWKGIRELTNLKRENYKKCLPYLEGYLDDKTLVYELKNL